MFHSDMNGLPRGQLDYGNFQNAFQKVLFIQHSPSCKVSNHGFQNVLKRNNILILERKQFSYLGCSSETSHPQNCRIKDRIDLYAWSTQTLKWSYYFFMVKQTQEHQ